MAKHRVSFHYVIFHYTVLSDVLYGGLLLSLSNSKSVCFIGRIDNVNVDTENKQMSHVSFRHTIWSKIIPGGGYKVMYKVTLPSSILSDTLVGHRINVKSKL